MTSLTIGNSYCNRSLRSAATVLDGSVASKAAGCSVGVDLRSRACLTDLAFRG